MIDRDRVADAAIRALEQQGLPVVRADMPGLYWTPGMAELTYNQLIGLACFRDPAFDPGRVCDDQR